MIVENENQDQNKLSKTPEKPARMIVHDEGQFSNLLDTAKYQHVWGLANIFAKSDLVPIQYKGKPENCFIAITTAIRLEIDPFMYMQNTFIVHGRPGMEAKLAIALVNARGPFSGPVQWRFEGQGKTRKCTAYATHKTTGEVCEVSVDWDMAEREGWSKKEGSKWMTMPDVMFRYRSATFLFRSYCPECLLGLLTVDEIEDISDASEITPNEGESKTKVLVSKLTGSKKEPESPKHVENETRTIVDDKSAESIKPANTNDPVNLF